jgi:2-keto-4-pentenoate hydratase/2-oxohepta-3-ene-1,7-dioic acid hydratase in catechol pathway
MGEEQIAEDNTRYYNFKVAELVSYISQFLTLEPGDVISCGTAFKPSGRQRSIHHANFQHMPGPVSITISGLGTLCNPIHVEDTPMGQWRLAGKRPA